MNVMDPIAAGKGAVQIVPPVISQKELETERAKVEALRKTPLGGEILILKPKPAEALREMPSAGKILILKPKPVQKSSVKQAKQTPPPVPLMTLVRRAEQQLRNQKGSDGLSARQRMHGWWPCVY